MSQHCREAGLFPSGTSYSVTGLSGAVGKEAYNLPIFRVNQAPEVAGAFMACCLGDSVLEKAKMKIQGLPLPNPQPSPRDSAGSLDPAETREK